MSNNFKFEFDFDEVLEGVKQGVIRELSETNFEVAKNNVINQLKSEIKNEIRLTYNDEHELKNEIKKEVKDQVFGNLLTEAKTEYKKLYGDYFNKQLPKELDNAESEATQEIKSRTVKKLYDDLYSGIQYEMNKNMKNVIAQLVNNLGGSNMKLEGTDKMITIEEYEELLHRNRILNILEQRGVDNWDGYGDFGDDEE